MVDRKLYNRWICVASALALLVAVMTSPLRPLRINGASSPPDCLRRNYAIPPTRSISLSLKSISPRAASIKAVRSENEEKRLARLACSAWWSLVLSPSPSLKFLPCVPAVLGPTRASLSLRC